MLYARRLTDYVALRAKRNSRLILSSLLFMIGAIATIAGLAFKLDIVFNVIVVATTLIGLAASAFFLYVDFWRWYDNWHDLNIVKSARFPEKVSSFCATTDKRIFGESPVVVEFDEELNYIIDGFATPLIGRQTEYEVPRRIRDYVEVAVDMRRPSRNENKIRLISDIDYMSLSGIHGVEIQKTDYFKGISTNEMADSEFYYTNRESGQTEFACSIFDDYVYRNGVLIPLSRSELSNHVGVTTMVVTSDGGVVLQRQGTTQVDPGRIAIGASGSADWEDLRACCLNLETLPTLQELVRFAMEREAKEELNADGLLGDGLSKTTITGFGRYLHRGGKPEFFGITYMSPKFSQIPMSVSKKERKWVLTKECRYFGDLSVGNFISMIDRINQEFSVQGAAEMSMSMRVCLLFARNYLTKTAKDFSHLMPA